MIAAPRQRPDPEWRPKLVVLDLDGTVVGYGNAGMLPSLAVTAAVGRVLDAGVEVVVATGRAVPDAVGTALALGLDGITLVCSNGAVVYDAGAGVVRHRVVLDPRAAVSVLVERLDRAAFAVEHGITGFRVTAGFLSDFTLGEEELVDLATLAAEPTTRMVCRAPHHSAAEVAAAAAALDPSAYTWELGYSAGWMDVMPPGVTKASGVGMVADDRGVDAADVLAIGDGTNDLALFGWAGYSVAMGQAPQVVQDAADAVTDPVDLDGCATALGWWYP